jgi:GTP-binding protein YchF
MPLSIAIVGLPNVGKSTLFQALTAKKVERGDYPFSTTEPNVGIVAVPDQRVDNLASLCRSQRKIYTNIEFIDVPGLVDGASRGEGLGNRFLARIRESDAILFLLRVFENNSLVFHRATLDPLGEKEILETELMLKDLETVSRRVEILGKELKAGGDGLARREWETLLLAQQLLDQGTMLVEHPWTDDERMLLQAYQFLSLKPRLYLLNGSSDMIQQPWREIFQKHSWPWMTLDVQNAWASAGFSMQERLELGLPVPSEMDKVIRHCYGLLDLITFLTTGPDETRAWTLVRGRRHLRPVA